jgi:DNA-binding transcriptional LysR family regulator
MTVELRQLRYALAAADSRSFRQAAGALRIKQSTLSRRIRQLEERLNVILYERSRAGVRATDAGSEFLRTGRRIIEEIDKMTAAAIAVGRGETGQLSVSFYTSLSAGNLRATLVDYAKRYPDLDIRFVHNSRAQILADFRIRTVDVAVVIGLPRDPYGSGETMPLWSERVVAALPASHPLASQQVVSWFDLKDEACSQRAVKCSSEQLWLRIGGSVARRLGNCALRATCPSVVTITTVGFSGKRT